MGVLGNANLVRLELRAAELTKQMLAYSGKGRFVVQPLDLSRVVREMAHLLGTVVSKKAVVQLHMTDGLPAVEADATQVRQIVMNLITNASDALGDEPGVITLTTGTVYADHAYLATTLLYEGLEPGEYVFVEVADTGIGMTPDTQAKIFDPFFTTKFTGRGLGLAAVHGIVRGHRGAIRLESESGRGTKFRILFPASQGAAADEQESDDGLAGDIVGGTVLVIDDEETVRRAATRMLRRLGFRAVTACHGREALDWLDQGHETLQAVLLDMMMPELSGEDTCREIRRRFPTLPIVLSSGYNEQDVTADFLDHGIAGFIQKPYRLADLRATLRGVLMD